MLLLLASSTSAAMALTGGNAGLRPPWLRLCLLRLLWISSVSQRNVTAAAENLRRGQGIAIINEQYLVRNLRYTTLCHLTLHDMLVVGEEQ